MENRDNNKKDRELMITKTLNAPIELVWEAWTKPEHIANWWGPNGFTTTTTEMNVTPGGKWRQVMHGPDGTDYKNESVYREVILHKKIVYEHVSTPRFVATAEFEAQGEQTLIRWHMLFETREQFLHTVKTFKADEGQKQNVEKLDAYVRGMSAKARP